MVRGAEEVVLPADGYCFRSSSRAPGSSSGLAGFGFLGLCRTALLPAPP